MYICSNSPKGRWINYCPWKSIIQSFVDSNFHWSSIKQFWYALDIYWNEFYLDTLSLAATCFLTDDNIRMFQDTNQIKCICDCYWFCLWQNNCKLLWLEILLKLSKGRRSKVISGFRQLWLQYFLDKMLVNTIILLIVIYEYQKLPIAESTNSRC